MLLQCVWITYAELLREHCKMDVNTNALRWQLPLMDDVCAFVDDGVFTLVCFACTPCILSSHNAC